VHRANEGGIVSIAQCRPLEGGGGRDFTCLDQQERQKKKTREISRGRGGDNASERPGRKGGSHCSRREERMARFFFSKEKKKRKESKQGEKAKVSYGSEEIREQGRFKFSRRKGLAFGGPFQKAGWGGETQKEFTAGQKKHGIHPPHRERRKEQLSIAMASTLGERGEEAAYVQLRGLVMSPEKNENRRRNLGRQPHLLKYLARKRGGLLRKKTRLLVRGKKRRKRTLSRIEKRMTSRKNSPCMRHSVQQRKTLLYKTELDNE